MTTATAPRVEYEDRFRAHPELMRGAEATLAFLDRKLGAVPLVPPPSVIRWALRPLDPTSVELSMADDATGLRAADVFPAAHLDDPVARTLWGLDTWGRLLGERSRSNQARIDRRIAAYAALSESNGHAPAETVPQSDEDDHAG